MKILSPGPCFLSPDQRAHECELRGGKAPYTSGARDGVSVCVCVCVCVCVRVSVLSACMF